MARGDRLRADARASCRSSTSPTRASATASRRTWRACATWRRRCPRCCWRRAARRTSGSTATGSAPPSSLAADTATADVARSNLASLNRLNYSFPPDHGAKVGGDGPRRPGAAGRLDGRARGDADAACSSSRQGLADALRRETNSDRFDFVAQPPRHVLAARRSAPSRWRRCARSTASTWSATAASTSRACPPTGSTGSRGRSPPSALMPVPFIAPGDVEGGLDWRAMADALAEGHRPARRGSAIIFVDPRRGDAAVPRRVDRRARRRLEGVHRGARQRCPRPAEGAGGAPPLRGRRAGGSTR